MNMKSLKAKFRKTDTHEWNKNDERLLAAVEHGEAEKVASLLAKKGANAVKLDSEGKSALHVAAARGQTECLTVILAHGAEPSVTDATGFNPLHLAARNNHVECCRKLIQSKCPIDAVDGSGKTALHHAAASDNIQIVQLLCELKSPINLKDVDGLTCLLLSAKYGHTEVCTTLLDCGAEINTYDNNGRTALMLAAEANAMPVVDLLVQRGIDLTAVDSEGHDVVHYAKLSGNAEAITALVAALNRQMAADIKSPKSPPHDHIAKLSDERINTPKKRKAPPPPISPLQSSGPSSPSVLTSTSTPVSNKGDTPRKFNYKEDELRGAVLREEVEKLNEERTMLLDTIEDLRQTVEKVAVPELDPQGGQGVSASGALVCALQAKITALTLENQQLANKVKKHPPLHGYEDLKDTSRPDSMASNSSFHSTQDEFETPPQVHPPAHVEGGDHPGVRLEEEEECEGGRGGSKEEIRLLRQALENVQVKLLETRKENRSLQAQLKPERVREREEDEDGREKAREEELMGSLAELQAKLTDTQERYHQALEEVEDLRAQVGKGEGEQREVQRRPPLEQEVKQLKAQLVQSGSECDKAGQRIRQLEEVLRRTEEERRTSKDRDQRTGQIEAMYKEAQEEVKALQEALRGTVPVEAAAKDFEEMKAELNEVIAGLQRRLLELSHSYSETKSQLSSAQKQLSESSSAASSPSAEQQTQALSGKVEELQTLLAETEKKYMSTQEEIEKLRLDAEAQAQSSVALADHTQVLSSLGNAIKELESEAEALRAELHQKTTHVEALQKRLAAEKDDTSENPASHQNSEQLAAEVKQLTQLLQGALRKQDEMALEAADAWQQARDNRAERDSLQELLTQKEKENQTLTSRLTEAQDAVAQLKLLVENHVASEREKNKRIDDLSREVGKLRDALNSLSQLSYNSCSPSKRQQQTQQLDAMQQQIKQLQYQLAESKKQHEEIVSVYRMHLLYAVQGQMDEDVQKALKQILMMCKVPSPAKEACRDTPRTVS